jgi:hypothetical protein
MEETMMRIMLSTGALVTVVVLGLLSPPVVRVADADLAEQYFKCSSGYSFQVSGQNVRCYKAGAIVTIMPSCPPGTALVQNVAGYLDMCRAAAGTNYNYVCPPLYPGETRSGQDMCVKKDPPSILAPTVSVTI